MHWYCVCKSQEKGYILTEIPLRRVLAGTEFQTCDLLTQIFFSLQPHLTGFGHFNGSTQSGPIQVASTLGEHFAAVVSKLSLTQSLDALKEFEAHLLGLHAPATELAFGFCQQHLEFPSSHPSKYHPGPMLLNFSVQIGTVASNMAWSANNFIFNPTVSKIIKYH